MRAVAILKIAAQILLHPVQPKRPVVPVRELLRGPRLFGLCSLFLQSRDLLRISRIQDATMTDDHLEAVRNYNAEVTKKHVIHTTRRPEEIYQILILPPRNVSAERLLIVGPRNIAEFLFAWIHGYRWKNITGIDLYSTNSKIQVMNMEKMTFPDESFDAVTMSATLAYAKDIPGTVKEVYRVLKPGGRFVFSGTHVLEATDWAGDGICGADQKRALDNAGFRIYHYHPLHKTNSLGQRQTSHMVGAYKPDPDEQVNDLIAL